MIIRQITVYARNTFWNIRIRERARADQSGARMALARDRLRAARFSLFF